MRLFGIAGQWSRRRDPNELTRDTALAAGLPPGEGTKQRFHGPYVYSSGPLAVTLEGQPRWLTADREILGASNPAEAVAIAYRRHGRDFLRQLDGSFALAVIDSSPLDSSDGAAEHATVLLAIDRMGIERLAYSLRDGGIVFSSSPELVANFPAVGGTLRHQALFDYLLLHMVPAPETVYSRVQKLRPGTFALFENHRLRTGRYWEPQFSERTDASFEELRDALHASLKAAVLACGPDESTGSFLSGGLDSTTVSGMLGLATGQPSRTFSMGFGVEGYDELAYARIAARHFGFDATEYCVTPADVVEAFPAIAAAYDEPFGNSSAVPTFMCATVAARHGITHMLAGDGGDEIYGGNDRYARHKVFEFYRRVPKLLRSTVIEPLLSPVHPENGLWPLRKLRSYVDQARIPMPERLESWNFMYRTDLAAMLDPQFHASIDPRHALQSMEEVFTQAPTDSLLNQMMYLDWHYTLSDNDLRKVGAMSAAAGVRVSYPMLAAAVVDLSLRVPSRVKMQRLELRSFYKRAMRGFLPQEILAKRKHGFGLPFGHWLKTDAPLADLIYSHLSALKSRRIVRGSFLDKLIDDHRSGHPSYFGYAIWDLAMLEAWLAAHAERQSQAAHMTASHRLVASHGSG